MTIGATPSRPQARVNTAYELFIGSVSVLSILNILLIYLIQSEIVEGVIFVIDLFSSAIFLGDFIVRFVRAPSKSQYFWREFGWADLVSAFPIPLVKILRVFSISRVRRLVLEYGERRLVRNLISKRAESTLLTVAFLILVLAEIGGIAIAYTEGTAEGANIKSGADAIWFVFVTITTVGYGDRYPVTEQGRLMALLIMMSGLGLLAVFTGYIARWFLLPPRSKVDETLAPQDPRRQLAEVQAELELHELAFAELRRKLNEIEKSL